MHNGTITAIRGPALSFSGDPFELPVEECTVYEADALLVMKDGLIEQFGPATDLLKSLPAGIVVTHYKDCLIMPGFIDCHVHYPQIEVIGAWARQLMDWLETYTFVAEQKFSDPDYAREVARVFLREGLRNGTTTSSVFCTVAPVSVDAFFIESEKLGMRNIAGKVLMDRNAPRGLLDTPQKAYDQSQALIDKWHNHNRSLYSVTPRFALTSSAEQMEMVGAVWRDNPGTYLQSHVSENLEEIALVNKAFPERKNYVDVYAHYGQLGERCILGHGIHLAEEEFQMLHDTGTAISHCPTSNLFLGSGLFDMGKVKNRKRPLRVGLATDLGGGTSFSQLVTMNEAYKIAQLNGYALSARHAFYLATRGAAHALYLDDRIGSLEVGMEADVTVLDMKATQILAHRLKNVDSLDETLFVCMTLGDDRMNCATYVAGQKLYSRDPVSGRESFNPPPEFQV